MTGLSLAVSIGVVSITVVSTGAVSTGVDSIGAVSAGVDSSGVSAGVVGMEVHLVQIVEVLVMRIVEVEIPVSIAVEPSVINVEVTGQRVVDVSMMTVV